MTLALPSALTAQIEREARAAFPRECCGLIEGVRAEERIMAVALHPAPNLSREANRFEIDPAAQFAALRTARASGHEIVGCYHSHPNGAAEPSPRDAEGAGEDGFIWLIAGLGADVRLAAFIYGADGFSPMEIAG